ncbi:MAG: type II secretion system minor pseudopilin GspJ [Gammaproteobacteria bacterium]|nr:type II secretion system minor pseudopilin GspJ [Gammaproteobacteria bacterium]
MTRAARPQGFTLIEVLIAMAIFAILALMAYGGLESVIRSKTQTEESMLRLRALQITMSKLQRDIEQISPRDGQDGLGGKLLRLSASPNSDLLFEFTRNGWRNPAKLRRSHLQRIGYRLDEDRLLRISWPYVDRAQDDHASEQELIDNIKELELRFLDQSNQWHDNWPPHEALASGNTAAQPRVIEVTLNMQDWGEIVRLFRVPPG